MTPPDAHPGFALAGVQQRSPAPPELLAQLHELLTDPAVGLVVVDERLADAATQASLRDIERQSPGLVVMLPAPLAAAGPEEDYVQRLIRRALGYQVRLGT